MNKFRFLEWEVYRDSKKLFKKVLALVGRLPREYRYELGSQLIRCVLSIILNIAEGSGKESDRELNRFFEIALGSVNEAVAALDIFQDNGFITHAEFEDMYRSLTSISNQLGGFKRKIRQGSSMGRKS